MLVSRDVAVCDLCKKDVDDDPRGFIRRDIGEGRGRLDCCHTCAETVMRFIDFVKAEEDAKLPAKKAKLAREIVADMRKPKAEA